VFDDFETDSIFTPEQVLENRGRVAIFIDGSNLFYAALQLGIEPKLKPTGRPVTYNTPDEALLARRAADRASKARQAQRISEAIKAAFEAKEAGQGKAKEASTQTV
jgi:hypothetical protein